MICCPYSTGCPSSTSIETTLPLKSDFISFIIFMAMKMMNEIKSDFSGKVVSIDVEDGQPVEYGQHIITIN